MNIDAPDPDIKDELILENEDAIFQLQDAFIVTRLKTALLIIDQQSAHERILFEKYKKMIAAGSGPSQQSLFPQVMEFSPADSELIKEISPDIRALGFDLQEFGQNTFVIHGTPADIPSGDEKRIIEKLIEQFKNNQSALKVDKHEAILRAMARSNSIRQGKRLDSKEQKQLVDELFACEKPFLSIEGKTTVVKMSTEEIKEFFKK
jgi:DNA mismatch repair protein MutL